MVKSKLIIYIFKRTDTGMDDKSETTKFVVEYTVRECVRMYLFIKTKTLMPAEGF